VPHADALTVCVLGSGSSGNCTAIAGPGGIVLVDCGFSPRDTRRRMESVGLAPAEVRAVVLTHPDGDHLHDGWKRTLGGLAGPRLVVRARHAPAVLVMGWHRSWIDEFDGAFELAGLSFDSFPLPHDDLGSTALRVRSGRRVAAHATDCGRETRGLAEFLAGADVLCLESNYDPAMQLASGRPQRLQDRIMGGSGHLSNAQALSLAARVHRAHPLSAVLLVHLSRQCNCPRLVDRLWAESEPALHARMQVTAQDRPASPVTVSARMEHATLFDG